MKCCSCTLVLLFILGVSGTAQVAAQAAEGAAHKYKRFIVDENAPAQARCQAVKGNWCSAFHAQQPVAWKSAPRGSKTCPGNCNGVGNCNYDTGMCECPAGWKGADCKTRQLRPCTNRNRECFTRLQEPMSHIGPDGRDIDWLHGGMTQSRCGGICDPEIGACWCDGPKGRIPAPNGSAPGTPPVRRGRPMITPLCQPKTTKDGRPTGWGDAAYDDLFGSEGWCVADKPKFTCPCIIDGLEGPTCEDVVEMFCVNQCSGHGTCNLGFCKCDEGWYGTDCSRKAAGSALEPSRIPTTPHLKSVVREPEAAKEPPPKPTRKHPLIYIYDLEPLYNSKMLQYRIPSSWCVHRRYGSGNASMDMDLWVYAVDPLFHEYLAQSEHRTFDPEEADFFYVPQYSSCYPFPIMGWADYPWFGPPGSGLRVNHASNMVLEVKRWVEQSFPYWNRTGGRDHIWMFTHDEGACWAPNEVAPSVWLTHWGRMFANHSSHSAFGGDNYNEEAICPNWQPEGWLKNIKGHACYDPDKDLVIPSFKSPRHYRESPLAGVAPKERDVLFFFKGDVGKHRLKHYSRGVRQAIYKMAIEKGWLEKYNVRIGDGRDVPGEYSDLLSRSKFCLVAPGDGWSARMEDAVLHGCIPVIIMDGVHAVFESVLDTSSFSLRVAQDDVPRILDILLAVPEDRVRSMQHRLSRVWHRFRWSYGPAQQLPAQAALDANLAHLETLRKQHADGAAGAAAAGGRRRALQQAAAAADSADPLPPPNARVPRPFRGDVAVDDAFATVMQWLHSRIPYTRGAKQQATQG